MFAPLTQSNTASTVFVLDKNGGALLNLHSRADRLNIMNQAVLVAIQKLTFIKNANAFL
jgi:hypothetical protein